MKFIYLLLKDFRFARRKLGGTWYYIVDTYSVGGMQGPVSYWSKKKPTVGDEIIKVEKYEAK
jgi:hypothetical protein